MIQRYGQRMDCHGELRNITPNESGPYVKYDDYATLAASHRRLVDAVRAERMVGEVWQVCKAIDECNAALSEAEKLIGEGERWIKNG